MEEDHRKVYIDFDLKIPYFDNCESFENLMILELDKYLKEYLDKHMLNKKKYRITYLKASRKEGSEYKISYHIIVNNYGVFSCHNKLETFIRNFKMYIPQYMSGGIDINVYHSIQNFRLLYSKSSKLEDNRGILIPKKIENNEIIDISINDIYLYFWDFLVKDYISSEDNIDGIIVNNFTSNNKKRENNLKINKLSYNIDNINKELINNFKKLDFINNIFEIDLNNSNNELISLRRTKKADCLICNRFHESDNAYIKKSKNNKWFFHCHREKMYSNKNGFYIDINLENNNLIKINNKDISINREKVDIADISKNIKSRSFKRIYDKYVKYIDLNNKKQSAKINAEEIKIEFLNINKKFDRDIYKERLKIYLSTVSENFLLYSKISSFNILDLSCSAFDLFLNLLQKSKC
jgi:hypothetical protein